MHPLRTRHPGAPLGFHRVLSPLPSVALNTHLLIFEISYLNTRIFTIKYGTDNLHCTFVCLMEKRRNENKRSCNLPVPEKVNLRGGGAES